MRIELVSTQLGEMTEAFVALLISTVPGKTKESCTSPSLQSLEFHVPTRAQWSHPFLNIQDCWQMPSFPQLLQSATISSSRQIYLHAHLYDLSRHFYCSRRKVGEAVGAFIIIPIPCPPIYLSASFSQMYICMPSPYIQSLKQ